MSGFIGAIGNGSYDEKTSITNSFSYGAAVVLNEEIHILGGSNFYTTHKKYSNGSWVSVSTLRYDFCAGSAVVLNNEIHILGSNVSGNYTKHYKYSNGEWTEVSTLRYNFYNGSAVVLDGEIHILGSSASGNRTKHYKYSNGEWTEVSTLPYNFYNGSAVVLDGEIHILMGNNHHKYSNGEWVPVSTIPYMAVDGSAVVLNGEIHGLGSSYGSNDQHFRYSNNSWVPASDLPYPFMHGCAVVLNNKIHILGSSIYNYYRKYYEFSISVENKQIIRAWYPIKKGYEIVDGVPYEIYENKKVRKAWIGNAEMIPKLCLYAPKYIEQNNGQLLASNVEDNTIALVYNNKIMIFNRESEDTDSSVSWYEYDGTKWKNNGDIYGSDIYDFHHRFLATVYNNQIYFFGEEYYYILQGNSMDRVGELPPNLTMYYKGTVVVYNNKIHTIFGNSHYSFNGSQWIEEAGTVPTTFTHCSSVAYNNKIYVLGENKFCSWDGSTWSNLTLPYIIYTNSMVVYDNKIHIFITKNSGTSNTCHYSFDGTSWADELTIRWFNFSDIYGRVVVYENEIHVLGGDNSRADDKSHVVYDGVKWILNYIISDAANYANWLMFNHKLYFFTPSFEYYVQLGDDFSRFISVDTDDYLYNVLIYDGNLHAWGSYDEHYVSSDGLTWTEITSETVPSGIRSGIATVFNNEIHFFYSTQMWGEEGEETVQYHYKYYNGTYTLVESSLPIGDSFLKSVFSLNNKIYLLGHTESFDDISSFVPDIYSWNGTSWTKEEDFPCVVGFNESSLVVSKNKAYVVSKGRWGSSNPQQEAILNHLYCYDGISWKIYEVDGLSFVDRGNLYPWDIAKLENNNLMLYYKDEGLYELNTEAYYN